MNKNQVLSMVAFSAVLMMVGFQNCAKVGVVDQAGVSNEKISGIQAEGQPADGSIVPIDVDAPAPVVMEPPVSSGSLPAPAPMPAPGPQAGGDDQMLPPVSSGSLPPVVVIPPVEMPPIDSGTLPAPSPMPAPGPQAGDDPSTPPPVSVGSLPAPSPSPEQPPVADCDPKADSDCSLDDVSESDAAALCAGEEHGHGKKSEALSGPDISHLRGNHVIVSDLLNRVEDIRGHYVIKGKSSEALAKLITETRGALIICGMNVDEISDSRGHLVLVNSKVKVISGHRGNIRLMNSEVGSTPDMIGNIKEIPKK